MSLENLVLMFVRWPEPGRTKTRLAATLGDEAAARIYERMVELQRGALAPGAAGGRYRLVPYGTPVEKAGRLALWLNDGQPPILDILPQPEGELADRLEHAVRWAFEKFRARRVVLIGSDCPSIGEHHLAAAFQALEEADVVFGPATDGGFYLMGLSRPFPGTFHGIAYSEGTTLEALAGKLRNAGARVDTGTLEQLTDVDEEADLESLPEEIASALRAAALGPGSD